MAKVTLFHMNLKGFRASSILYAQSSILPDRRPPDNTRLKARPSQSKLMLRMPLGVHTYSIAAKAKSATVVLCPSLKRKPPDPPLGLLRTEAPCC
jgi:hypothetical protein